MSNGIFSLAGLGSAQLPPLSLVPVSQGGDVNPLASGIQTYLKKDGGFPNLTVDGNWGDCSQSAFIQSHGDQPKNVRSQIASGIDFLGIDPKTVPVMDKSNPSCRDGSDKYDWGSVPDESPSAAYRVGVAMGMKPQEICGLLYGAGSSPHPTLGCSDGNKPSGLLSMLKKVGTKPTFSRARTEPLSIQQMKTTPAVPTLPGRVDSSAGKISIAAPSTTSFLSRLQRMIPSTGTQFPGKMSTPGGALPGGALPGGALPGGAATPPAQSSGAGLLVGVVVLAALAGGGYLIYRKVKTPDMIPVPVE